ncbi:hypothetical protein GON26_03500 [Flavobacterium sp. GA093]|uniref:Addiction module component n=1 Tax=Flavobacterium hydrocarbonoxydans TaxID=2683249 RepID=A0A6I4NKQ3_9FLAO|nr:hypothetical protein [Flavobacterium hydrocarbonoxydans]MWB93412.1 hypothetical protein [Flavobacterium hydrocarbonoxydans]
MDLQTRKIAFVQEFLKLQSEEVITQLENLLHKKNSRIIAEEISFEPMSIEEFNTRIDKSEQDFKNGKFKTSEQLLAKYK